MMNENENVIHALVASVRDEKQVQWFNHLLEPMMPQDAVLAPGVGRAQFAAALNIVLFTDILGRVPEAKAYVEDVEKQGGRIQFDHGAIRSIAMPQGDTGALPRGEKAFRRLLEPLGYEDAALYPLPALKMTGRAYRHKDFPETIPQFFVSELHVDQFDDEFADAAQRVFGASKDPLDDETKAVLARFAKDGQVDFDAAVRALPVVISAFERQHDRPMLADYEILKKSSGEAAWIATEGNAFNHATDRVADVVALAEEQKKLGRPIKDKVEFSRNGRVRQTAYRAAMVERVFGVEGGPDKVMAVPGSFHEFISRDRDPDTGQLDLSFDSGNATAIFHMTK
ncbi:MAG: DUF1338 family protein [Sphingobium sp.]|nr:DUF1338 family protein [Sphingobium sp.]